jgi:hypothetical protein|tara:strand:- start:4379 stop:4813 length:435 start_codon:yes stop_codon:yes gene_type:complete
MIDNKTKMFLIKAMTEGLDFHFPDNASIDYYIEKLRETIDNNKRIKSVIIGDYDGLLIEDNNLGPYAVINFSSNLITFGLIVPEPELTDSQSLDFGRIVLACVSTISLINAELNIVDGLGHETDNNYSNEGTIKFNISDIGVII